MLAQAFAQMGEKEGAVARLLEVERVAAGTPLGAEAQRGLFLLREPVVAAEVDAVLRLVATAQGDELDVLAGRAQRLALAHGVWMAYFAAGIAERRREKWSAAREAFEAVLALAPGVTAAREELVAIEEAERSQGRAPSEPPPSMGAFARLRQTLTRAVGGRRGGKG
jgi:hypothetical protein